MKKFTKEEADKIIPVGRGRSTLVSVMVQKLEVGEGLQIESTDWVTKTPPYKVIKAVAKKLGRTFRYGRMPDKSGYFVQRLT